MQHLPQQVLHDTNSQHFLTKLIHVTLYTLASSFLPPYLPMAEHEQGIKHTPAEQHAEEQKPQTAITVRPGAGETVLFQKTQDGGITISFHGEVRQDEVTQGGEVRVYLKPSESPVRFLEEQTGSLMPQSASAPATEPHSAGEEAPPGESETVENENRKFELVGNPVRDPSFRVRKSGKRIADFVLATHPEEEKTEYWRIRAFDRQAEKVRDQVRKGQTGVEATVYGPKQWQSRRKTKEGWTEEAVEGYYAGFVRVPKRYRQDAGETKSSLPEK